MESIFLFKQLMKKNFLCGIKIATFCHVQGNNGSRQWSSLVDNIPPNGLPEINVSSDGVIQLPLEYSCPMIFDRCCVQLFATPWTAACQASLSLLSHRVCSNSCPLSWWCHPTVSSSGVPFSSWLQSFPASRSFPMSWLFISGGWSIRVSASASVLPMNIQGHLTVP